MKIPTNGSMHRSRVPAVYAAVTLVELLVVVSIVVALMGLVSAAFTGIGKAGSLANAGNKIAAMASVARQNSITRNALTAMIIPAGSEGWNSCILYELTPKADGSKSATADWRPISKLERLPQAIVIDDCAFMSQKALKDFPDLPAILPAGDYYYIVFTPTGALYPFPISDETGPNQTAENPAVRLAEGVRTGKSIDNVIYTGAKKGGAANFYRVTILSATGLPKIDRS